MIEDIERILAGKYSELHIDKVNYQVKYSQEQKAQHNKQLMKNGVNCSK